MVSVRFIRKPITFFLVFNVCHFINININKNALYVLNIHTHYFYKICPTVLSNSKGNDAMLLSIMLGSKDSMYEDVRTSTSL